MELKDAKGLKVYLKFFHLRSYPQVSKSISLWLVMGRWEVSADFTKESVWQSELLPVQENYFTYLKLNSHSASTKETHMFLISPRISSPYSHCFYFKTVFFVFEHVGTWKLYPTPKIININSTQLRWDLSSFANPQRLRGVCHAWKCGGWSGAMEMQEKLKLNLDGWTYSLHP